MCQALQLAHDTRDRVPRASIPTVIRRWSSTSPTARPRTAIPNRRPTNLRNLASTDGNVLLFNAHLSDKQLRPIEYPDREEGLPDKYAQLLFRMSSVLPPKLQAAAKAEGFIATPNSRGFVFNADLVAIVRFLDIGTQVASAAVRTGTDQ